MLYAHAGGQYKDYCIIFYHCIYTGREPVFGTIDLNVIVFKKKNITLLFSYKTSEHAKNIPNYNT